MIPLKILKIAYPEGGEIHFINLASIREVLFVGEGSLTAHISFVNGSSRVLSGENARALEKLLSQESIDLL